MYTLARSLNASLASTVHHYRHGVGHIYSCTSPIAASQDSPSAQPGRTPAPRVTFSPRP